MKNAINTNNDLQVISKKFKFCINNDTDTELTEQACISFMEWLKTPQNSKRYIDSYGIIPGGWCINLSDVVDMYHICTTYDALTGGVVDVIYITFNNSLLNRIVYLDNEIAQRGTILLPIGDKIEYIPFSFKYVNGTRKRATNTTKPTKTQTKTQTKTTEKTDKTTPTKTKTPKTATKTTKTTDKKVVTE